MRQILLKQNECLEPKSGCFLTVKSPKDITIHSGYNLIDLPIAVSNGGNNFITFNFLPSEILIHHNTYPVANVPSGNIVGLYLFSHGNESWVLRKDDEVCKVSATEVALMTQVGSEQKLAESKPEKRRKTKK